MSFLQTALLGALAGSTIFLGLPLGRMQRIDDRARVALAMFAVGILTFIFVDVLQHGLSIVQVSVDAWHHHGGAFGAAALRVLLLGAGFTAGSAGLGMIERTIRARAVQPPVMGGAGAAAVALDEATVAAQAEVTRRNAALYRGFTIAAAIGLHNFAEGLAIGVSARAGAISLATVLIIGFALHNATEGFGIVGPLGDVRPSWRWLGVVGVIGGGPTFAGTLLGYTVTSTPLELAFYALAAGAILYVIGEVWHAMRRYGHRELGLCLLAAGFLTGVLTDIVVSYGGG
ncbi:MAG: ZIP family metal transporter [Solirubrobacteraceae bacterium]